MKTFLSIFAVLSFISLAFPGLVGLGLFLILPGIVLIVAPTVFTYSFLAYIISKILIKIPVKHPYILSMIFAISIGCIAAITLNFSTWKQMYDMQNSDIALQEKVAIPDTVAIFLEDKQSQSKDSESPLCNATCQHLLFNKATKKVIVGVGALSVENIDPDKNFTSYTIAQGAHCLPQGTVMNDRENVAIRNALIRIASGECLIKSISVLGDAGLILTRLEILPNSYGEYHQHLNSANTYINQISLFQKTEESYKTIYRHSKISANPFIFPLSFGTIIRATGGNFSAKIGFYHYNQSVNYTEKNFENQMLDLLGDAFAPLSELSRSKINEILSGMFGAEEKIKNEKQIYFDWYVDWLRDYTKKVTIQPDDIHVLSKAIADPDILSFGHLRAMIVTQKEQDCLELQKHIVNRLMWASERDEVIGLVSALSAFSDENLAEIREQIHNADFTDEKREWIKVQSSGRL